MALISGKELKETESLLGNLLGSQSVTASQVTAWMEQRKKSIEVIGRLQKRLENLHRGCNAANSVGSAMQAVGGLAMVAGTILTACGHRNVGEFLTKKLSPATGVAGFATEVSSAVAETELTRQIKKDVEMLLEKDNKCTELLVGNLQHSRRLDSYLRRIFNCSILSGNFLDVVRLVSDGISLLKVGYVEYSELQDELMRKALKGTNISELTETVIQNVCATMKKIRNDPEVQKAVSNICDVIQRSPSAFAFTKLGLRISFQICDTLKVDIFASLLGCGILKTSAGVMATKCLLGTVLIAINVLSAISAVQNAKEGTSKHSEMLKELNLALAMELNTFRNNYSKLL